MRAACLICAVVTLLAIAPARASLLLERDGWLSGPGEYFVVANGAPAQVMTIRNSAIAARADYYSWAAGTTRAARLALRWVWRDGAGASASGGTSPGGTGEASLAAAAGGDALTSLLRAAFASFLGPGAAGGDWPAGGFSASSASSFQMIDLPVMPLPMVPVPEPSPLAVFGVALLGLVAVRRHLA